MDLRQPEPGGDMFELDNPKGGNFVILRVDGRVQGEDYDRVIPRLKRYFGEHGQLNMLVVVESTEGLDASNVWEELGLSQRELASVMRFGVVGDAREDAWIGQMSAPLMHTEVRYFDVGEEESAERWVRAGRAAASPGAQA
ncbi:STAS/SEC14 domain-containing protein [Lujinxingia vulgaris]|uniref:STAS/SEC14 domain-containing protein n=2 Tax=Lujinxingia vulgaris TaxID=2600176 RepID=A0A5C6XBV8_9DELT|nr:STAS/SEC14 domain-containing protein [Lujinxingia vulgaris]